MNKEEILQKSRQENEGRQDEREIAALGNAARVGMAVGALVCVFLVLVGELVFHVPEISLVGWLVYFTMQGSSNIVLYRHLKVRGHLARGIIEIVFAAAFAAAVVFRNVV